MASESRPYDRDNPYEPRHRERPASKWYKKTWVLVVIGIIILGLVLLATGKVKFPGSADTGTNQTQAEDAKEVTEMDQLVQYIIEQKKADVGKEDIFTKLRIAGYSDRDIETAYTLSDPIIQYILVEQSKNVPKASIVEALLKEGHTPEQIQEYFAAIESTQQKSLGESLSDNWWIIALVALVAYFIYRQQQIEKDKKAPKVYTLEECREYAQDILKEKRIDFNPTVEYRNRPEIKQYRYVFEEPIYPEFNAHKPLGYRPVNRQYYLLAVGYDKELVDFRLTEDDNTMREFLHGAPRSYESRGAAEYMRLRERSEMPLVDAYERERPNDPRNYPFRPGAQRRPLRRPYSPGPIEGYEEY